MLLTIFVLAGLLPPVEPFEEYDLPVEVSKHLALRQKRDNDDDFDGK